MVLKKSNSCLNSGATQRFCNRGALVSKYLFGHHVPVPETISVFLNGHEDNSNKNLAIYKEALKTIYEFLDVRGPNLESFYDRDGFPRVDAEFNEFSFTKNGKKKCTSMSDKIKEMVNRNILGHIFAQSVTVEIEIKKFRPSKGSNKTIWSWNSTDRKKEDVGSNKAKKLIRKRKLFSVHNRGLQRPQKVSNQNVQEEPPADPEIQERKIRIVIQESHYIDARLVKQAVLTRRIEEKRFPRRILSKNYHFNVNLKGYNFETLKLDEMEALTDILEEEEYFGYSDYQDVADFDESFEESIVTEFSVPNNEANLEDYMSSSIRPSLENNIKKKSSKMDLVPVNSASSEVISKQGKGSYVLMKAKSEAVDDMDSGVESNSSETTESLEGDHDRTDSDYLNKSGTSIDSVSTENVQFDFNSSINNFIGRFVPIDLTLPSELVKQIQNFSSLNDLYSGERYPVGDCHITFGNCYPPSFTVKAKSEMTKYYQNFYLIVKAYQFSEDNLWSWQLQVGNVGMDDLDPIMAETFFDALRKTGNSTLQNLVTIFQELIVLNELHQQTQNQIKTRTFPNSLSLHRKKSSWPRLKDITSDHSQTVCIQEALRITKSTRTSDVHTSSSETNEISPKTLQVADVDKKDLFHLEDKSSVITCDICFLPCDFSQWGDSQAISLISCGHTFCLNCWSSHVLLSLCSAYPITCMNTECKQELNETLVRTLAPGGLVSKWCQRIEQREIEQSPVCKWCPNTHCDKIGIVKEASVKRNQFGSLVLCECQIPWCFSCQTEPHWPASCDQISAFRKLLEKTGNDLEVPSSKVNLTIELKLCPRCKYPIEKSVGCPSMVCRMCWLNFCWNCLRPVDHVVYTCKPRNNNFTTFRLENKLVHQLPLRYFSDYLKMNKKRRELDDKSVYSWLQSLHLTNRRLLRMPFRPNNEISKENAQNIAKSSVHFIREVYTLLEPYYVLLCFVNMNKEMPRRQINAILKESSDIADTLRFVCWRLEEQLLFKNLISILKHTSAAEKLLECGKKQMYSMKMSCQTLQVISKNIDPSEIAKKDPKNFLRYK